MITEKFTRILVSVDADIFQCIGSDVIESYKELDIWASIFGYLILYAC